MRVLVLGSGGREHALAWKLAQGKRVEQVFAGPGNAGTGGCARDLPAVNPARFETIADACRLNRIDCVFVGPEGPLADGVVDYLAEQKIPAIGPHRSAARLESSKSFSKAFMQRNGLPTAEAEEFADASSFEDFVRSAKGRRLVVKKSGLAAGKGVLESSRAEDLIPFGRAILQKDILLVEEFLDGWEVSIFGLSDGKDFIVLPPCTDFKKARDGDQGPNTGGMGSICPVPWVDPDLMNRIRRDVVEPTYAALSREGLGYAGVLYFGLMITADGPKLLEFNARFGDPEAQVILVRMRSDIVPILQGVAAGQLKETKIEWAKEPAVCVVLASKGYPDSSDSGRPIQGLETLKSEGDVVVFHAATNRKDGALLTIGGRVLGVTALGANLDVAVQRAYEAVAKVSFEGMQFRKDIGQKALARLHAPK